MGTGRHSILWWKIPYCFEASKRGTCKASGASPQTEAYCAPPYPLDGAGGGVPPPAATPLSYPLPFAPPLTLNPASAPDHQCTGNQNPTVVTYLPHASQTLPQILYDTHSTLRPDKNGDANSLT